MKGSPRAGRPGWMCRSGKRINTNDTLDPKSSRLILTSEDDDPCFLSGMGKRCPAVLAGLAGRRFQTRSTEGRLPSGRRMRCPDLGEFSADDRTTLRRTV